MDNDKVLKSKIKYDLTTLEKELSIYKSYQEIIAPFIMELEVRDIEYPVEILNEIRAIFTHLARYKLQNEESDLNAANSHVRRATLDCFKYICISIAEKTNAFREKYKHVDLKLADNGKFLPELDRLEKEAQNAFKKAKISEIKNIDENEKYCLYEEAYNAYSVVEKHIDDSLEAILFASNHSKKSNTITIVSCIITVISIIVAIVCTF